MSDEPKKPPEAPDWERLREMNEALLVSSARQHELTEQEERAAALREEHFRRAIEEAPIPVIMHAEDGEVLQISRRWTDLTGYTIEDESVIQSWLTRAYGYGGDDLRSAVQHLFGSGADMRAVEFVIETRVGARRVWSFSASSPGALLDGRRFVVGMAEDITERKRNENALRQSEERFRQLVEQVKDYAIFSTDLKGRAVTWNEGVERVLGFTESEFIGQDITETIFTPEDVAAGIPQREIEDAARYGVAPDDRWMRRRNGERFFAEGTTTAIKDEHESVTGFSKVMRDQTKVKEADEKLRESEEQFRTLADNSRIIIWLTDPVGRLSFVNQAFLDFFAIRRDQTSNFDWSRMVHPDDLDAYSAAFETAVQKGQTFHHQVRMRRLDGQWRWFECHGNPIFDAAGLMTGYIGSWLDITDIHESQQALKDLARRKDEFLANMSHEIRSPLTGIMGYADILLTKLKDPEDIEYLKTIKESGDYLIEIVNDILDLAKIEAGKLVLNVEAVAVHALLAEVQGMMDVRARQKNLCLSLRYEGTLPQSIRTDRIRLRQILINLASNAIKFTERGRVEIVVKYIDNHLRIEVIDTGIGIAPEHQEILFQPFTQADTTSTRQYGGTGLGLTISRRLAEMLDGTVSFESELGKGSTFRVMIPAAPAGTAPQAINSRRRNGAAIESIRLRDRRVLVVDDREEICYLVSLYITDAGGRAFAASNGQRAIEAIRAAQETDPFDAMILDIHMPDIDGYEVARRLRASGSHTPIIALTAGAMVGDREKCLAAGCNDYLTKPIDRQKLVELVARHAQPNDRESRSAQGKRKVLIVDDSQNACKLLSGFLEKRGYEIRSAYNGESALLIAQDFCPEVILLDIRLPDMDGFQLLQRLKRLDGLDGTRFIALSGYRDHTTLGTVEFDHFLEKPFEMVQLETLLRSFGN